MIERRCSSLSPLIPFSLTGILRLARTSGIVKRWKVCSISFMKLGSNTSYHGQKDTRLLASVDWSIVAVFTRACTCIGVSNVVKLGVGRSVACRKSPQLLPKNVQIFLKSWERPGDEARLSVLCPPKVWCTFDLAHLMGVSQ